jgi:hypothetical protein
MMIILQTEGREGREGRSEEGNDGWTTLLTTRADQKKTGTPAKRMRIGKTHEQTIKSGSNTHAQELLPVLLLRGDWRRGEALLWWDEEFSFPSFQSSCTSSPPRLQLPNRPI